MGRTSKAVAPTVLFCSLKIELDSDRGPVAVPSIVSVIPAPDEIEKQKKKLSTQHMYTFSKTDKCVCAVGMQVPNPHARKRNLASSRTAASSM